MRAQLKQFIDAMEPNSIAIIPAAHESTRSYDTEYKFRQDSDFWYLTGFPEPDAVAVALVATTAGQAFDRIADHASIMGARLRYLITGDPDHLAAEVR